MKYFLKNAWTIPVSYGDRGQVNPGEKIQVSSQEWCAQDGSEAWERIQEDEERYLHETTSDPLPTSGKDSPKKIK